MNDLSLTIRSEAAGDAQAIERLHERTFGPVSYTHLTLPTIYSV